MLPEMGDPRLLQVNITAQVSWLSEHGSSADSWEEVRHVQQQDWKGRAALRAPGLPPLRGVRRGAGAPGAGVLPAGRVPLPPSRQRLRLRRERLLGAAAEVRARSRARGAAGKRRNPPRVSLCPLPHVGPKLEGAALPEPGGTRTGGAGLQLEAERRM